MEKYIQNKEQNRIKELLYEVITENNIKLTDLGFQNLIIHLHIAIMRIKKNEINKRAKVDYSNLKTQREYQIAITLGKQLEQDFDIIIPELEIHYITIHLLGKKTYDQYDRTFVITDQLESLLHKIYVSIEEVYGFQFENDFELYTLLAFHFQPMIDRLRYQLIIQNPILKQIKEENLLAFEMAVLAGKIIRKETGFEIDENEIGYIALHFALAIDRKHLEIEKRKIIIVCASGQGSSQILLYKVRQRFKDYLNEIKVTHLYDLKSIKQDEYDFILSTVPIGFKTSIPVIEVQYFLDSSDILNVKDVLNSLNKNVGFADYFNEHLFYTDITGTTRNEIIDEMCLRIRKYTSIPNNFETLIYEREEIAPTELGNQIAFPHPIQAIGTQTFVAVAILKKAIRWERHMVQFVFLLSIKQNESKPLELLHSTLTALFFHKDFLCSLEKNPTTEHLFYILGELTALDRVDDDIFS